MLWVSRARFCHQVIPSIHDIMPGAAMPVVVPGEVQDTGALHIESDIEVVAQLVKEMARIGSFVATASIISAPHVRAHADALLWPQFPTAIGIESHGHR